MYQSRKKSKRKWFVDFVSLIVFPRQPIPSEKSVLTIEHTHSDRVCNNVRTDVDVFPFRE